MNTNYSKYEKAFSQFSVYVITEVETGSIIGSVKIKHPPTGGCKLQAFVHENGHGVAYGAVMGYGYDKTGAAIKAAVSGAGEYSRLYDALASESESWLKNLKAAGLKATPI